MALIENLNREKVIILFEVALLSIDTSAPKHLQNMMFPQCKHINIAFINNYHSPDFYRLQKCHSNTLVNTILVYRIFSFVLAQCSSLSEQTAGLELINLERSLRLQIYLQTYHRKD